jgi:hypothetical protein
MVMAEAAAVNCFCSAQRTQWLVKRLRAGSAERQSRGAACAMASCGIWLDGSSHGILHGE